MRKFLAVALAATAISSATPASAAKYIEFYFYATGSGTEFIGSREGTRPNREGPISQFSGTLYYHLEGGIPPLVTSTGVTYAGSISTPLVIGRTSENGFRFDVSTPFDSSFISYGISGSACYGNSAPFDPPTGTYSLDPSCSQITATYGNGYAVYGYNFTGTLQSVKFRIVEGDFLPAITFSIPEPSTWALMLAGFGMVGYAMRRRKVAFA